MNCECSTDGYCSRYKRHMGGRLREICAGINVDLGTAAAFREEWARKAGPVRSDEAIPLTLVTDQAPGDTVAMTAALYSLHNAYPGKYCTSVESPWPEVFEYNPYVSKAPGAEVRMHYPAIHKANERAIHFMQGWCEFLGMALGIHVPLLTNRPILYFPNPTPPEEDFWVVCSGGKNDFTNKLWGQHNYQDVVNRLKGTVNFVQVGTDHQVLGNVESTVGKTSLRDLFNIVRRAKGVLCGVSLLMHVAAALGKPAVVIAGGREPVAWNTYPKQHYLHTVGMLPCSPCWRARVVPLGDGSGLDADTCERPVNSTPTMLSRQMLPECMTLIKPSTVADLISRYQSHQVPVAY